MRSLEELLRLVQNYQPSLAKTSLLRIINDQVSPRLENVEAIAHALNTTVAYLIGETDDPALQPQAGTILPVAHVWSDRLKNLEEGQRELTIQAMELVLRAVEARNSTPQ